MYCEKLGPVLVAMTSGIVCTVLLARYRRRQRPPLTSCLELGSAEMLRLASQVSRVLVERQASQRSDPCVNIATADQAQTLMNTPAPELGTRPSEVIKSCCHSVLSHMYNTDHPRFLAYVPGSTVWPAVLADFLTAGYNVHQASWNGSSGPSAVELCVLRWISEWLGLPSTASGAFTSGGCAANLNGLLAAREAAGHPEHGTVYLSDSAHLALTRGAHIMGVRRTNIRKVPMDADGRIDPQALKKMISADRADGRTPMAVCATAGATGTGLVDPLSAIAEVCAEQEVWFHIDAAFGGFAVLCAEGRQLLKGIEHADSVAIDAHKMLFQPYEAGCLLVRDVGRLVAAFSDTASDTYIRDERVVGNVNFFERGLQMTRSCRALKVWVSVHTFGVGCFRRAIEESFERARYAEECINATPFLKIISSPSLGVLVFGLDCTPNMKTVDDLNMALLARLNDSGFAHLASTTIRGQVGIRLCMVNHKTSTEDVRKIIDKLSRSAAELLSSEAN